MIAYHDHDEHHEPELDDEERPGPNFLAQFRPPMSEEELDKIARAMERVIAEVLAEVLAEDEGMIPDNPASTRLGIAAPA